MPGSMRYRDAQVQERLAREYVLGTMSAAVRRRFQRLLNADADLQAQVLAWQQRLQPLADGVPPLTPPRAVWIALAERLGHTAPRRARKSAWLNSLALWRGLSAITSAAVLVLAVILLQAPEVRPADYLAVMAGDESVASIVASARKAPWELTLELVKTPPLASDKTLHLWAVSAETGKIHSLGAIGNDAKQQRPLTEQQWLLIKGAHSLIVTEEAQSAALDRPTGPVRYRGLCVQLG